VATPTQAHAQASGLFHWLRSVAAALGIGVSRHPAQPVPEKVPDLGTRLAQQRTHLAIRRSFLAAERTLMAWVRTALSMISFGFTLVKVLEALEAERGVTTGLFGHQWSPTTLGLTLIGIGTGSMVMAVIQHRRTVVELRQQGLVSGWSLALIVSTFIAVLGVFAYGSLVLNI
jgi:putative membrane protein